jgi:hypothetical protein
MKTNRRGRDREVFEHFLPFLQNVGVPFEEIFFQQVAARQRTANAILFAITLHLDDRVTSNHFPRCFGYGWS